MISNPNTNGRNFPLGIPKVYAGQSISTGKFNDLSSAIYRNSITGVKGASVSRTSSGTSIILPNEQYGLQPFETMVMKNSVIVYDGNVWTNENYEADAKQIIPSYDGALKLPKGDYTCSIANKTEMKYPFATVFPVAGGDKLVWIDTSGEKPDLKYTEVSAYTEAKGGVAIAYIDSSKIVYQITVGNVWMRDKNGDALGLHPFKIIANWEDGVGGNAGSVKCRVHYGTINNIVPDYENGKSIADTTVRLSCTYATNYIWLKVEGLPYPAAFPTKATIILSQSSQFSDNFTHEGGYGYIRIGQVTTTPNTQGYGVGQAVRNSIRAELHRFRQYSSDAFYYAI